MSLHAAEVSIEGRVFTEVDVLPGAKVLAHRSYGDLLAGSAPLAEAKADKKGLYSLSLQPGEYFFSARGISGGKEYFSYHGSNPIKLGEEKLWLALNATSDPEPVYGEGPTAVSGKITYQGRPLEGAFAVLYRADSKMLKGLGVKAGVVDSTGRFTLSAPAGNYLVIGKKIAGTKKNRPPKKGDFYCYYSKNPILVKEKQTVSIELACYPIKDRNESVTAPKVKTNDVKTFGDRPVNMQNAVPIGKTNASPAETKTPAQGVNK